MESFFKKNKIFLAILIGAIIISAGIYFGLRDSENKNQNYSVLKDNFISKTDNFKINNSECLAKPETIVTKVIDGDTIVVEGGYHIRLLSIDADETGFPCYQDAKTRLEELV
ncbi:MAG: hypothetical protein Q7S77_02170, partial [Candidatus Staskawiczbacteria bacterium]|nr:hypothetical protein [Candidatus Staskawiczbacteria bacterium]